MVSFTGDLMEGDTSNLLPERSISPAKTVEEMHNKTRQIFNAAFPLFMISSLYMATSLLFFYPFHIYSLYDYRRFGWRVSQATASPNRSGVIIHQRHIIIAPIYRKYGIFRLIVH
ncbi:hypothetical protein DSECCO2_579010 [anaerobic digester metagenome]